MSSNIGCESPKLQVTRPVQSKVSRASISGASHSQSVTGSTALTLWTFGHRRSGGMDSQFALWFIVFTSLSRNRSEATLRDTGTGLGKYLRYLPHRWMDEQWQFIIQPCLGIGPKSPYAHLAMDGFSAHYRPSSKDCS